MSYSTKKGWSGEHEAAEFFNNLVKPEFHICRIGGIEFQKSVHSGDIAVLQTCKKHFFFGKRGKRECFFDNYFLEVKAQANPSVWSAMEKAEDDAELSGKVGAIGYMIKQERGGKGKRLIVMRPEVFEKLYNLKCPK